MCVSVVGSVESVICVVMHVLFYVCGCVYVFH